MTQKDREQIATGRFHIISPIVNRATSLNPGEVSAWFREATQKTWTHEPYWRDRRFGWRTLERWKQQYDRMGFDGLMPAMPPPRPTTAIPETILRLAESIRKEMPELSVETVLYQLYKEYGVARGTVNQSTLSRHFRRMGLTRQHMKNVDTVQRGYRRFEAEAPMDLWQSDFQHTLSLPDPMEAKRNKTAKLCLILDDHSRYIIHAQFYWDERMPSLEDSLKKAIEKRGIPTIFYCDNGSAYSSGHIAHICARLGIRLSHSRPYKPQGRGKAERAFRFVDTSFLPLVKNKIKKKQVQTLDDLNRSLQDWIEEHYHERVHGETEEPPRTRMGRHPVKPLPFGKQELRRLFFLEETRKVDKTGTVSLNGLSYQVPAEFCGLKIQIRYDPYDPSDAEVYLNGVLAGKAEPSDPVARYRKRFRKENPEEAKSESVLDGQLVFSFSGETAAGGRNRETHSAMEVRG
jgi:transposase InsO family protein